MMTMMMMMMTLMLLIIIIIMIIIIVCPYFYCVFYTYNSEFNADSLIYVAKKELNLVIGLID
jgi:uncharacterized SAM-binding protein YcdF (DUF218 family)